MPQKTLFSFGHGYSAQALARRLIPQGWTIFGTTRSEEKAAQMRRDGVEPILLSDPNTAQIVSDALSQSSHLLISAGPNEAGDPFLANYSDALRNAATNIEWVGYLSTTGVYGDHDGGWVDEDTPLTPATKRGQLRVMAEGQWTDIAQDLGLNLAIFRLAGIYGPGRGPFAKVRSGSARRIIKPGQVFSRIHVEDIALTLEAAIDRPDQLGVFNVCDDFAAPPQDVIGYAAELLGLPLPPEEDFASAEMSPMARSFYAESKKVRNDRIKNDLGVDLIYPDYKTGLRALLALDSGL